MKYNELDSLREEEEFDLGFPPEESSEERYPKLIVANRILHAEHTPSSRSKKSKAEDARESGTEERVDPLKADPLSEHPSPLSSYLKSICSFRPLSKEE